MSRCIALVRSPRIALSWTRCTRESLRGDRFCLVHRDHLNGAVMGMHQALESADVQKTMQAQRESVEQPSTALLRDNAGIVRRVRINARARAAIGAAGRNSRHSEKTKEAPPQARASGQSAANGGAGRARGR
jgi:hypothetical protein